MCPNTTQIAAPNPNAGHEIVLWPDGTWCWNDEFDPAEWSFMSDDYEVIDMGDMPRVERLTREDAQLCADVLEELR
ncbi:hypothetical protein GR702_21105 [Novosphingobium sp. FGD1]|uniref:Uncharacterized protein n=2 Tax=Novosphingobium TaxID=165696 RepID=T0HDP3_9SPHN|nr:MULTISPECIES: hypothetical protein [Novosphingobium]EQB10233.1 hypothetical protein L284_17740 [Novosphingobium lindaniclasticum LE124]MYM00249.1 hypothetical protein [Novosphingobium silvae]